MISLHLSAAAKTAVELKLHPVTVMQGKVGVSAMCILGFNVNKGQEISLRLRTDDMQVNLVSSCLTPKCPFLCHFAVVRHCQCAFAILCCDA